MHHGTHGSAPRLAGLGCTSANGIQSNYAKILCMEERRVLRRADELRALAHPLRVRMLSRLQDNGPATATALARVLGESTGATSFHLRQLARFGLIREDTERGTSRERWWQASARHYDVADDLLATPEHEAARSLLLARVLEHDERIVAAYLAERDRYPAPWRDTSLITNHVVYLTPGEFAELSDRLRGALETYERPEAAERPADAQRVYGALRLVPWTERAADAEPGGA